MKYCTCKMKVDTHKSVGVYFFRCIMKNRKDVKTWARKEHHTEGSAKKKK